MTIHLKITAVTANLLRAALPLILCLGCSSPNDEKADERLWRFAIEEAEGSVQHEYAMEFKRQVEAASNGAIEVVVYPYGALGTSTQMTEQLNLGALEFAMASPGSIGKFIPETQVFLLHFALSNSDEVNKQVLASPRVLDIFDELYAEKGLKLLSIFPEGEMVWTTQKEIRSVEDFRGVKMRVMTSPILIDAYEAYGASPTPLPYSEVYSALQLGMVDAQVNPVFAIERQKFYEVTEWLSFPGHAHFVTTAAANRRFYERLSPEDRQLVDDTILELNDFIFERQLQFQTERLKKIIREKHSRSATLNISGDLSKFVASLTSTERRELVDENEYINITSGLTSQERQQFEQASRAVRKTYLEIGGARAAEMLDLILEEVRRAQQRGSNSNASQVMTPRRLALQHVPNPVQVHSKVICGGLPEGDVAFQELRELGIRTIISVDGAKPDVEAAEQHGLRYIHLPHGYDGIPNERVMELAKAVRELDGPVYIHCHHGKHRSPAAASVACVVAGLISETESVAILELAGTSPNYRGLYESVGEVKPLGADLLDHLEVDFPESAEIPPMAEAMVAIDRTHDHLKLIADAGWQSPAKHPDLDPAHEALLMREHFAELLRTNDIQGKPEKFRQYLQQSEDVAKKLEDALRDRSVQSADVQPPEAARLMLGRISASCKACHQQYRDIPLSEKHAQNSTRTIW